MCPHVTGPHSSHIMQSIIGETSTLHNKYSIVSSIWFLTLEESEITEDVFDIIPIYSF